MSKSTRKYVINIGLILLLTGVTIYLSVKDDFTGIVDMLAKVKVEWLVLSILISLLYHVCVGYILKQFARIYRSDYTMKEGIVNALIAALFHGLTPSASGGQIVQAYVFHKQKIEVTDSASILLMDFIVYQATLVVYSFILLVLRFQHIAQAKSIVFHLAFLGFLVNLAVIIGLMLLAKSKWLHDFLTHKGVLFFAKLKMVKNPEEKVRSLEEKGVKFRQELSRLGSHKPLMIKIIAANVVRLSLYNTIPYFALLALGTKLNLNGWFDLVAMSAFVGMVNAFIPSPGASGGTEGTYILMFQSMFTYLPRSLAVGSMLIWRFVSFHLIMIVGVTTFILFKRRLQIKKMEVELYENRIIQ